MSKRHLVRNNIIMSVALILILMAATYLTNYYFGDEMTRLANSTVQKFGYASFIGFSILSDIIASPVPTDAILFLLVKLPNSHQLWWAALLLGFLSSLVGALDWYLAKYVIRVEWFGKRFVNLVEKNKYIINDYGKWGVALGALTPVPFSMTCWAAGILQMKFTDFYLMSLLRVPRFMIVYGLLLYSNTVAV